MSVYRNHSGCNCCPRQTNLYKGMKRKTRKLNYNDDWASSKIPDYPFIHEENEANKHAYEVCCKSRKRKVRTPGKEYLSLNQHEGLEKSKSSLGYSDDTPREIYGSPLAQKFFIANKKPKWREELEKRLQKEAMAERDEYIALRWQKLVKKLEAQDKFRQLLEQNQKLTVRWRLEKEQVLRQSENDLYGKGKHQENREKSSPEQIEKEPIKKEQVLRQSEKDLYGKGKHQENRKKSSPEQAEKELIKSLSKIWKIRKYKKKVDTGAPDEVLNTPLGKYEKIHRSQNKMRNAQKSSLGSFDQILKDKVEKVPKFYSLRKSQPLPLKIQTNQSTHVGAKFSWIFREMMKAKAVTKPKMSKSFNKLIKGKNVEIPELMPALKSREKILTERNLEEGEREKIERAVKHFFKSHKSRLRDESEPNYGVSTIDKSRDLPPGDIEPKFSELFHNMLRGKEINVPELNEALMSHHEILPNMKSAGKPSSGPRISRPKKKSEPNYKVSKIEKAKHTASGNIKPKVTQQIHKMQRGKAKNVPELNEVLMSHHKILPDMKRAGKASSGPRKSRTKKESEPNYEVPKTEKAKHTASGDIKPKVTQQIHKMLRGKAKNIPEPNEVEKSHHDILPDTKGVRKASSVPRISRPKKESEPNYEVSKMEKDKHTPSGDIKPKFSEEFHKMPRGKEENISELNEVSISQHEILPDIKRAGKASSVPRISRPKKESEANYEVSKMDQAKHTPSGAIKSTFSEQFNKLLRGNETNIPELNQALMSHHEILPDMKGVGKTPLGPRISRPKKEPEPNYGVSKTKKAKHRSSGDIKPKISQKFNKMLKGKENNIPELNEVLMSHHKIFPDIKRARKASSRSRKSRPKKEGRLKKFRYYIRNSLPDWKILKKKGSKSAIPYLHRKSFSSVITEKSDRISSMEMTETAERMPRLTGSIIRTEEFAQFFLPVREKKAEVVERKDKDDVISDTIPKGYHSHYKKVPSFEKALIDQIASFATADKDEKLSKSASWIKPESSSASLKRISDEIKKFEENAEREQYHKEFVIEDKAVVQARIQELMKYVIIREDFQPPKPPRNFIKENIEMLQKKQPRKIAQVKKKRKPIQMYPPSMKKQQLSEAPDFCESLCRNSNEQLSDIEHEHMKIQCCSSQDQYQKNLKESAETVDKEDPKCDLFLVPRSGYSNPESNVIQKTKPQKLRKRKRGGEAFNQEENKENLFLKQC